MFKRVFSYSSLLCFVFSVACSPKVPSSVSVGSATNMAKDMVTPAGQRKFIDPANMNMSVRPQDDFYEYANGAWLKATPIPATESRWGSFNELAEFNRTALKTILDDVSTKTYPAGTINQKVSDFYVTAMDSAKAESLGFAPVKPRLDRIAAVKNYKELLAEIATEYSEGNGLVFSLYVGQDDKNSSVMVPKIGQSGLHLPDRDYYLKDDDRYKKIRASYETHIINSFKLIGASEAKAKNAANLIMTFEKQIAKASTPRAELRDPEKRYNKMTIEDLEKICPQMNWAEFLKKQNMINAYYIIGQPIFMKEVSNLLKNGTLDEWKTYITWDVLQSAMSYLSHDFVVENFNFSKALSGQKEIQPRWKTASSLTDRMLGEALGQIYVDKYFKPEAKQRLIGMIDNMAKVFEGRIKNSDWMSAETKTKALAKLGTFVRKIGYPDKWMDYTPLTIDRNKSYYANVMAAIQFQHDDMVSRLGKPIDRTRWGMTPPTVNAYYSPTMNEIVFPAGILQFPFYDPNADDACNYGGIGAVIGHEMTHGFDDQGRQYDLNGNLSGWWNDTDNQKFGVKADQVMQQYNAFTVLDTIHVNGKLTQGENLADFGGLSMAYEAYKTFSPQAKTNTKIDGFTGDQRLFLAWAQVWRTNIRPEAEAQQVVTDPHSPGRYRCNGPLKNMVEFYNAFDVKPGDKMYRADADRAKVW